MLAGKEANLKPFSFEALLKDLSGVGPQTLKRLQTLGLETFRDALFHFPIRYEDRTHLTPLKDVRLNHKVLVQGKVQRCEVHRGRGRKWLEVILEENGYSLSLIFFHFSENQRLVLERLPWLRCFGEVVIRARQRGMVHPEMKFIKDPEEPLDPYLTPIYPATQGLHQGVIRKIFNQVLTRFEEAVFTECLPKEWVSSFHLMTFQEAMLMIHKPEPHHPLLDFEAPHPALTRLSIEELAAYQSHLRILRQEVQHERAISFQPESVLMETFIKSLPFQLTGAQQKAWEAISHDLMKEEPMMRLVQGDVGSGKTVIAALACLAALQAGKQAAMMAPTEILAAQHYEQFLTWFAPFNIPVILLNSKQKASERKALLKQCEETKPLMVIGTHALFQDAVNFGDLALMVVDEQHRFGVVQRVRLREKGKNGVPHQLIMTATPIPRSLAMTRFADLDLTVIDELPPNRLPVTTLCVCQSKRQEIIDRIRGLCKQGTQVYWVCPLIEESEKLQVQAAEQSYALLKAELPEFKVALVHGKIKQDEKESLMNAFKANKIQVLVATTVIEVGVNVPNASLMVIENPERLGLAQLHQLRGRVGRGSAKSYCVLLFKSPLSPQAQQRLSIMRDSQDGFKIAEMDLKIRGSGEVLGVRQTGTQMFKVVDFGRDAELIEKVNSSLRKMDLKHLSHLAGCLSERWIGWQTEFAKV